MRSFIISLILFLLVIGLTASGACYIHHTCNTLLTLIDSLPAQASPSEALFRLEEHWEKNDSWLRLVLRKNELNTIEDLITQLNESAKAENPTWYNIHRSLLQTTITDLRDNERLLWD